MTSHVTHVRSISDGFMLTAHLAYGILCLSAVVIAIMHFWSLGAPVSLNIFGGITLSLVYVSAWFVTFVQRNFAASMTICLVPVFGMLLAS